MAKPVLSDNYLVNMNDGSLLRYTEALSTHKHLRLATPEEIAHHNEHGRCWVTAPPPPKAPTAIPCPHCQGDIRELIVQTKQDGHAEGHNEGYAQALAEHGGTRDVADTVTIRTLPEGQGQQDEDLSALTGPADAPEPVDMLPDDTPPDNIPEPGAMSAPDAPKPFDFLHANIPDIIAHATQEMGLKVPDKKDWRTKAGLLSWIEEQAADAPAEA